MSRTRLIGVGLVFHNGLPTDIPILIAKAKLIPRYVICSFSDHLCDGKLTHIQAGALSLSNWCGRPKAVAMYCDFVNIEKRDVTLDNEAEHM